MKEVNEFDRNAIAQRHFVIGPGFLTNGKPEESLKPTQEKADIDIISSEASEQKNESILETVTKTFLTAPEVEENLETTEPETQLDLESVKAEEEKNDLTTEQVPKTQPLNGHVVEKISETDSIERIKLKLASEESEVLLEGLEEATGCSSSTLLLANIYRVSNANGKSQLVLKQGKNKQQISTVVEGDIIIKAISRLRKFSETRELLKLPQP